MFAKRKQEGCFTTVLSGSPELSYKKQEGILYNQILRKLKESEKSNNFCLCPSFLLGQCQQIRAIKSYLNTVRQLLSKVNRGTLAQRKNNLCKHNQLQIFASYFSSFNFLQQGSTLQYLCIICNLFHPYTQGRICETNTLFPCEFLHCIQRVILGLYETCSNGSEKQNSGKKKRIFSVSTSRQTGLLICRKVVRIILDHRKYCIFMLSDSEVTPSL